MNYFKIAQEGNNKWYIYIITILLIIFLSIIFSIPSSIITSQNTNSEGIITGISKNCFLLINLLPFVGIFIALVLSIKFFHFRKVITIFTGNSKFKYKRMFKAMGLWLILLVVAEFVTSLIAGYEYRFTFDIQTFIPLFIICIILIPIQAASEELLIRGYLMQAFGVLFKNKYAAIIMSGIIFGLLHISNPEVKEYGILLTLPSYIYMGLFFGFLVMLENGLETAIGVHVINNIYATVFITFPSSALPTDAIFTTEKINPTLSFIMLISFSIIFTLIYYKPRRS